MQRVGSKGPAAELVRVLVCRLAPNLLQPEVLHAAMEEAEQSQEGAASAAAAAAWQLMAAAAELHGLLHFVGKSWVLLDSNQHLSPAAASPLIACSF